MQAPSEILSGRLRLAAPQAADVDELFQLIGSDAEVTRYVGWPRHRSRADTLGFLAFSQESWRRDGVGPYVIRSRANGVLLGTTGTSGVSQPRDLRPTRVVSVRNDRQACDELEGWRGRDQLRDAQYVCLLLFSSRFP